MFTNGTNQLQYRRQQSTGNSRYHTKNLIEHKVHPPSLSSFKQHQWQAKATRNYNNNNHRYSNHPWTHITHHPQNFHQNNREYHHRFLNVGIGKNHFAGGERNKSPLLAKEDKQPVSISPWQTLIRLLFQGHSNNRLSSKRRQQPRQAGVIASAGPIQSGLAWMATMVGLASVLREPLSRVVGGVDLTQQLLNGN